MSLQQQVILRHRADGHLRFSLPAELLAADIGKRLVAEMAALEGVYRVDLFSRQGKLSIRYVDTVCSFGDVVRRLYAAIGRLSERAAAMARSLPVAMRSANAAAVSRRHVGAPVREWLKAKAEEVRETVAAIGIMIRRGMAAISQRPRWLHDFANDLLMLYLIKLHWHHITTLWLPRPWTYRYEWLATFYLIYLHVQSKLPQRG